MAYGDKGNVREHFDQAATRIAIYHGERCLDWVDLRE
jgi:hypothetical protein